MVTHVSAQADTKSPQKEQLLNGLKVLMWPNPKADKVWVRIRVHAGSAFDPQGKEGVMQLLADNIFPNPATKDFFAEDLGGSLEVIANYDFIQINASSKPENMLQMLETLSTAISNPLIDREQTANLRNVLLARVKELSADPAYVADRAAAKRLLGGFPYGRPQFGTPESLQKIDFADLLEAKQRFLTADNGTVALSGNFDKSLAFRAVRRYFGGWLKSDKKVPATFREPDEPLTGLLVLPSPKPDTVAIHMTLRGVARNDKEFPAAKVYARIIKNRLEARVPAAEAANIAVHSDSHVLPGQITIALGALTEPAINAKLNPSDLLMKILSDPVTQAEFDRARAAAAAEWAARAPEDLWLDVDTYKTADAAADRIMFDSVKFNDVTAFATKLRSSPLVSVLVNTPGKQ